MTTPTNDTVVIGGYRSLWKAEDANDDRWIKVRDIDTANSGGTTQITQFKGWTPFTTSTIHINNQTRPFDDHDRKCLPSDIRDNVVGVKIGSGGTIEIRGSERHMAELALAILQQVDLNGYQQERIGYFRAEEESD